jgi:hypothetical protein
LPRLPDLFIDDPDLPSNERDRYRIPSDAASLLPVSPHPFFLADTCFTYFLARFLHSSFPVPFFRSFFSLPLSSHLSFGFVFVSVFVLSALNARIVLLVPSA